MYTAFANEVLCSCARLYPCPATLNPNHRNPKRCPYQKYCHPPVCSINTSYKMTHSPYDAYISQRALHLEKPPYRRVSKTPFRKTVVCTDLLSCSMPLPGVPTIRNVIFRGLLGCPYLGNYCSQEGQLSPCSANMKA